MELVFTVTGKYIVDNRIQIEFPGVSVNSVTLINQRPKYIRNQYKDNVVSKISQQLRGSHFPVRVTIEKDNSDKHDKNPASTWTILFRK